MPSATVATKWLCVQIIIRDRILVDIFYKKTKKKEYRLKGKEYITVIDSNPNIHSMLRGYIVFAFSGALFPCIPFRCKIKPEDGGQNQNTILARQVLYQLS